MLALRSQCSWEGSLSTTEQEHFQPLKGREEVSGVSQVFRVSSGKGVPSGRAGSTSFTSQQLQALKTYGLLPGYEQVCSKEPQRPDSFRPWVRFGGKPYLAFNGPALSSALSPALIQPSWCPHKAREWHPRGMLT